MIVQLQPQMSERLQMHINEQGLCAQTVSPGQGLQPSRHKYIVFVMMLHENLMQGAYSWHIINALMSFKSNFSSVPIVSCHDAVEDFTCLRSARSLETDGLQLAAD